MKKLLFLILPYLKEQRESQTTKIRSFVAFPYGVLSIATYLKKHNPDVVTKIVDCNINPDYMQEIIMFNPDMVAMSMMFDNSYQHVKEIAGKVKDWNSTVPVVMGGAATTNDCERIVTEQPDIDAVCFGEGEIPFSRILMWDDIPFRIKSNPSFVTKNSVQDGFEKHRTLLQDLDDTIAIDYSFVNVDDYRMQEAFSPNAKRRTGKQFFIVTSRGCPFNCRMCMNSSNPDKTMRYASVDKIIDHVRFLVDHYGMEILTFYDDQLLLDRNRAKEMFRRLAEFNLRIECPNGLTVAFIDDELAGLMRKAGMDSAQLAIESGSEYVLKHLINKPLHLHQVKPVVDILHKHGFWVQGYFVTGMPGETDAHRKETVDFIKEVGLDWSGFAPATPYRGSLLWKECAEKGYIDPNVPIEKFDSSNYIIRVPGIDPQYIADQTYLMNLDVNFINNYNMRNGNYKLAMRVFQDVIERYPDHAIAYYCMMKCAESLYSEQLQKNPKWSYYLEQLGV
jgi:anaerobic magnesium-protoporphyrin IX monomethyl ester cyclase